MNSLIWDGNTACLLTVKRKRQRQIEGVGRYDFDALKVARGGLLEEALADLNLPINAVINSQSLLMLESLANNKEALIVLGTPATELVGGHILRLYEFIEDHLEKKSSIVDKNTASTQYRFILSTSNIALGSGEVIREIAFKSRFISTNNILYKTVSGLINHEKLILVDHEDEDTLQDAVLQMMKGDLKKLEDACWNVIERYKMARNRLLELKEWALSNPDQARKNVNPGKSDRKVNFKDSLSYKLASLHMSGFERYESLTSRINWSEKDSTISSIYSLNGANSMFSGKSVAPELALFAIKLHEAFYLEYYLPIVAIEAAELLFLIYTGWNTDTVISITQNHIKPGSGYYDIHSVKSKNNQTHAMRVFRKEHPRFYELIELLTQLNLNVDRLWQREDTSLFVAWSSKAKHYRFRVTKGDSHKWYILKPCDLPDISKSQIRDQVANIFYLETNDIFKLKELLGHADVLTTLAYLDQHAIRIINEANMRRFMDKLAATIIWATGGIDKVDKRGLPIHDIDERLLFPIGDNNENCSSICDEWLSSLGKMKFTIGPREIGHLNWQIHYYEEFSDRLKQNNPKAYLLNHVPRMLFCAALREVVAHSRYSQFLKKSSENA